MSNFIAIALFWISLFASLVCGIVVYEWLAGYIDRIIAFPIGIAFFILMHFVFNGYVFNRAASNNTWAWLGCNLFCKQKNCQLTLISEHGFRALRMKNKKLIKGVVVYIALGYLGALVIALLSTSKGVVEFVFDQNGRFHDGLVAALYVSIMRPPLIAIYIVLAGLAVYIMRHGYTYKRLLISASPILLFYYFIFFLIHNVPRS